MNKEPNDNDLWNQLIKTIKKINYSKNQFSEDLNIKNKKKRHEIIKINSSDDLIVDEIQGDFARLVHGSVDNIDRNTAKKFNKGDFEIERVLDLHGKTEEQAFNMVNSFIKSSFSQGLRCILIITGKGKNSSDVDLFSHKAILKNSVPKWLNNDELRGYILSFNFALPKDGGEGALQILLKRKRV